MSELKFRRLIDVYYGPETYWNYGGSKISQKERLEYYDEKDKEWVKVPTLYNSHYPYDKD